MVDSLRLCTIHQKMMGPLPGPCVYGSFSVLGCLFFLQTSPPKLTLRRIEPITLRRTHSPKSQANTIKTYCIYLKLDQYPLQSCNYNRSNPRVIIWG